MAEASHFRDLSVAHPGIQRDDRLGALLIYGRWVRLPRVHAKVEQGAIKPGLPPRRWCGSCPPIVPPAAAARVDLTAEPVPLLRQSRRMQRLAVP